METELIRWLCDQLPKHPNLLLGIGDDAAVLQWPSPGLTSENVVGQCVATVDLLCDGVDFILDESDPQRVGRKALAVNLSDLAAMAVRPVAVLVSLNLPQHGSLLLAQQLYQGMFGLLQEYDVCLAGGDTNIHPGPLTISITALGQPTGSPIWKRSGAKLGDKILVTGDFGGSILGKHFDFRPRVSEALLLSQRYNIHAAMDVSDGLSLDLSRLAIQSQCGAQLLTDMIPLSAAAYQLAESGNDSLTALEHGLSDGEDFELLLTLCAAEADRLLADQPLDIPLTEIGTIVAEPGMWLIDKNGKKQSHTPIGYLHQFEK